VRISTTCESSRARTTALTDAMSSATQVKGLGEGVVTGFSKKQPTREYDEYETNTLGAGKQRL